MVGGPSQRFRSGRETLPKVRKWSREPPRGQGTLPEVRKWSGNLFQVRMWSGDPPEGSEVVGRPFQRSGSGRGTLPKVRKWEGVHSGVRK